MEESLSAGLSQGRAQIYTVPIILSMSSITPVHNSHTGKTEFHELSRRAPSFSCSVALGLRERINETSWKMWQ